MKITPVHPRSPDHAMPFAPGMLVERARYLFVAGCGPVPLYHKHPHDPDFERPYLEGGIREQTKRAFENIKLVLSAAGASLRNVVRVLIFITDGHLQDDFNEVYQSYFRGHAPPRTFVVVPALVHDGMLVEIEVTAAVPEGAPGEQAGARRGQKRTVGRARRRVKRPLRG